MNDEIKLALNEYLQGFLKLLGENPEIQIKSESQGEIFINLQGFIAIDGSDPKPLRSLSYLAEIAIRRKLNQGIKVYLDANGFQERRRLDLHRMAEMAAQRAIQEGKPVEMEPMETQERKLVHEILSHIAGVKTHSEGQGEERRVVVEPLSGGVAG